jgi:putative ABC transport system ATP-binding protein
VIQATKQLIEVTTRKEHLAAIPAIQLKGVTKHFGEGNLRVTAIREIALVVNKGDFAILVGPSGSGKSTLLNIIAGLEVATEGEILIDGKLLATMSDKAMSRWRAQHVGLMFQSHNLIPVLSSYHNAELPLTLKKCSGKERRDRTLKALERVGLSDRLHHYPNQLSLGEQQRVAIARSVVHDPAMVILDEPTGNLDRRNADEILGLLKSLNRELEKTIIMVTHDSSAVEYATKVFELNKGVLR